MDAIERQLIFFVRAGGGEYMGIDGRSVVFKDPKTKKMITLYIKGIRNIADIRLALKNARENFEAEGWHSRI